MAAIEDDVTFSKKMLLDARGKGRTATAARFAGYECG